MCLKEREREREGERKMLKSNQETFWTDIGEREKANSICEGLFVFGRFGPIKRQRMRSLTFPDKTKKAYKRATLRKWAWRFGKPDANRSVWQCKQSLSMNARSWRMSERKI